MHPELNSSSTRQNGKALSSEVVSDLTSPKNFLMGNMDLTVPGEMEKTGNVTLALDFISRRTAHIPDWINRLQCL